MLSSSDFNGVSVRQIREGWLLRRKENHPSEATRAGNCSKLYRGTLSLAFEARLSAACRTRNGTQKKTVICIKMTQISLNRSANSPAQGGFLTTKNFITEDFQLPLLLPGYLYKTHILPSARPPLLTHPKCPFPVQELAH